MTARRWLRVSRRLLRTLKRGNLALRPHLLSQGLCGRLQRRSQNAVHVAQKIMGHGSVTWASFISFVKSRRRGSRTEAMGKCLRILRQLLYGLTILLTSHTGGLAVLY